MRKLVLLLTIGILSALLLTGCKEQEESFDETTISIDKKGRVSEQIVESFAKDYYDIAELEGEYREAISDYDSSIGEPSHVTLKKIELKEGRVYISLDFASTADYEGFVNEVLFDGTINEAYDNGYTMDVILKGTATGDKIGKVEIMGMMDKRIIILSEPVVIKSYKPIAYVSANVELIGEKEARVVSESGGIAYIVLDR